MGKAGKRQEPSPLLTFLGSDGSGTRYLAAEILFGIHAPGNTA